MQYIWLWLNVDVSYDREKRLLHKKSRIINVLQDKAIYT